VTVAVVGGGGFGRGLALAVAREGRPVVLWSRQRREIDAPSIRMTTVLSEVADAELVFLAVPSVHVGALATELGAHLDGSHLLVHVSRGLIGDELGTLTNLLRETTAARRVGALAGPLVANALASGQPGGGIVGSLFPEVADAVCDAIAGKRLRIYRTDDVVGVEVASAMVGLMALALGYAQGLGFGPSTLAVLATRGLAEAARIGVARGADERTFAGLAGSGDLMAAVAGDARPEIEFGRALAEGHPLEEAARRAGAYVEGSSIAAQVAAFADRHGIKAPVCTALSKLIRGTITGERVITELMSRPTGRRE
jgi:glycerol-3-phosphate dehydrogenase (NAD(P)+)